MLKGFTKWVSDGVTWPRRKIVNVEYLGSDNKTLQAQISPEEFELQVYFKSLSSALTPKEKERLFELIGVYGDAKYNEGYEAAEIDSED